MRVEVFRRLNQANPELTLGSVKPKLESGDIFMAKVDGGGEQPGQIPEKRNKQEPLPVQGGITRARRALGSRIAPPRIAHALLDNPSEPIEPRVAPLQDALPVAPEPVTPLTEAEQRQEAMNKSVKDFVQQAVENKFSNDLTPEQEEALNEVSKLLMEDPLGFAKAFTHAIDLLELPEDSVINPQEEGVDLVRRILEFAKLPDDSRQQFSARIQQIIDNPEDRVKKIEDLVIEIGQKAKENESLGTAEPAPGLTEKEALRARWDSLAEIPPGLSAEDRDFIRSYIDLMVDSGRNPDEAEAEVEFLLTKLGRDRTHEDPDRASPELATFGEIKEFMEKIGISIRRELRPELRTQFEVRRMQIVESAGNLEELARLLQELQADLDREIPTMENLRAIERERAEAEAMRARQPQTAEEVQEFIDSQKAEIDQIMEGLLQKISGADASNFDQIFAEISGNEDFNAWIDAVYREKPKYKENVNKRIRLERHNLRQRITNIGASSEDVSAKKMKLAELVRTIGEKFKTDELQEGKDQYNPVTSVQELGKYIAITHGADLWGEKGIHPIIDENGEFHPENMIIWMREQTNKMHTDNRSDAISPLGSIHINTGFRDVSLYEMVRLNRQRYMRDARSPSGEILDSLAEELIMESWAFGQIRNASLAYVQAMNEDKRLPEVINQIHARSDLTHGETLRILLKMSDSFGGGDLRVGRAVLYANDVYYHLSDWQKLVEIFGGKAGFGFIERFNTQGMPGIIANVDGQSAEIERMARQKVIDKGKDPNHDKKALEDAIKSIRNIQIESAILKYISDPERAGGLGVETLTKDDFRDAIRVIQGKNDWEDIDDYDGFYSASNPDMFYCKNPSAKEGGSVNLFDTEGRFDILTFVRGMNIYNDANPDISKVDLLRELIRLKAAKATGISGGIARDWDGDDGKNARRAQWEAIVETQKSMSSSMTDEHAQKEATRQMKDIKRKGARVNIEFAEHLAEAFQRPYGGAARNDTNRRGYDALTKMYLEEYLVRQSAAGRGGPVGVREAVGIYRNVGPDHWAALKTETGYSPVEVYDAIRDIENNPNLDDQQKSEQIKAWIDELKFATSAEKDIAGNVQSRGFQMFHAQTGGHRLELDKLVSYDPFTGVKINLGEWEDKFSDGIIKPARYFGSTNGGMKWTSKVRRLDSIASDKNGFPTYETVTLAEASYGPKVIGHFKEQLRKEFHIDEGTNIDLGNLDALGEAKAKAIRQYMDYGEGRIAMVKIGLALDLGAQLLHHRNLRGHAHRWGYVRTEAFFHALEAMEEIKSDGKGGTVGTGKTFFDHELMELIREEGRSKKFRLAAEDLGLEMAGAGGPLWGALIEMLARIGQASVR